MNIEDYLEKSFLYVAASDYNLSQGQVKIGLSTQIRRRLRALQTGSPPGHGVRFLALFEVDVSCARTKTQKSSLLKNAETAVHLNFAKQRIGRDGTCDDSAGGTEWFQNVSVQMVRDFIHSKKCSDWFLREWTYEEYLRSLHDRNNITNDFKLDLNNRNKIVGCVGNEFFNNNTINSIKINDKNNYQNYRIRRVREAETSKEILHPLHDFFGYTFELKHRDPGIQLRSRVTDEKQYEDKTKRILQHQLLFGFLPIDDATSRDQKTIAQLISDIGLCSLVSIKIKRVLVITDTTSTAKLCQMQLCSYGKVDYFPEFPETSYNQARFLLLPIDSISSILNEHTTTDITQFTESFDRISAVIVVSLSKIPLSLDISVEKGEMELNGLIVQVIKTVSKMQEKKIDHILTNCDCTHKLLCVSPISVEKSIKSFLSTSFENWHLTCLGKQQYALNDNKTNQQNSNHRNSDENYFSTSEDTHKKYTPTILAAQLPVSADYIRFSSVVEKTVSAVKKTPCCHRGCLTTSAEEYNKKNPTKRENNEENKEYSHQREDQYDDEGECSDTDSDYSASFEESESSISENYESFIVSESDLSTDSDSILISTECEEEDHFGGSGNNHNDETKKTQNFMFTRITTALGKIYFTTVRMVSKFTMAFFILYFLLYSIEKGLDSINTSTHMCNCRSDDNQMTSLNSYCKGQLLLCRPYCQWLNQYPIYQNYQEYISMHFRHPHFLSKIKEHPLELLLTPIKQLQKETHIIQQELLQKLKKIQLFIIDVTRNMTWSRVVENTYGSNSSEIMKKVLFDVNRLREIPEKIQKCAIWTYQGFYDSIMKRNGILFVLSCHILENFQTFLRSFFDLPKKLSDIVTYEFLYEIFLVDLKRNNLISPRDEL